MKINKKVIMLITILTLICNLSIYAQENVGVKIGGNLSKFRTIASEPSFGCSFCITADLHIFKKMYMTGEFLYSNKKGIIRDVILGGYVGSIFLNEIHYTIGIIDFPLLLKLKHSLFNKNFKVSYFIGPSFSTRLTYSSKIKRGPFLYQVSNMEEYQYLKYDFEYIYEASPVFEHGLSMHMGAGLSYSRYQFEIRYVYDQYNIKTVGNAVLDKQLHSWVLLLGFIF